MTSQDLHHLAAAYALDALDPDERRAFERHYPSCEICAEEVIEFRETAAVLATDVEVAPSAGLKASIMGEVARTRQLPPNLPDQVVELDRAQHRGRERVRGRGWTAVAAAAAAAVVAVAGTMYALRGAGTDAVGDLVARPDAVVASLEGDDGSLRIVWSPSQRQVALLGGGLDVPAQGETYALWFLGPDGAAPAALFEPDDDGTIRTVLAVGPGDPEAWGVTIEPDGGSPQPTGEVLYSGEL